MTYLTKNLEFFSNLDGMQVFCAEKMFVKKGSPSQALPRQLPQRGSQAITLDAKVSSATRSFPAAPPLPQEAGAAVAVCRYDPFP